MWVLGGGGNKHCDYVASGSSLLTGASPLDTSEVGPLLATGHKPFCTRHSKGHRAGGDQEQQAWQERPTSETSRSLKEILSLIVIAEKRRCET